MQTPDPKHFDFIFYLKCNSHFTTILLQKLNNSIIIKMNIRFCSIEIGMFSLKSDNFGIR